MSPTVFLIENNTTTRDQIKACLEAQNYEVITADNGQNALELLIQKNFIPDIFVSAIEMPKMDGYSLYRNLANDLKLSTVPFIFLTESFDNDEKSIVKLLGADDYLAHPVDEDELVACITGKITRYKKNRLLQTMMQYTDRGDKFSTTTDQQADKGVYLLLLKWDETQGPIPVKAAYPSKQPKFDVPKIGSQLFQASYAIYGHDDQAKAQSVLLDVSNINKKAYLYFFSLLDSAVRGGHRLHLLAVLNNRINILDLSNINDIIASIATDMSSPGVVQLSKYRKRLDVLLNQS